MNVIEPAKSSRSTCRSCNQKIEKAQARLGVETEFTLDGNTVTSLKWYHLQCGMDNLPDHILTAKINKEVDVGRKNPKMLSISGEELEKIEKFREKHNRAGLSIVGISELSSPNEIVNTKAKVLRKMKSRKMKTSDGESKIAATVYVEDENFKSKIILWEPHDDLEINPDQTLVVIKGKTVLASNENIQVYADENSQVLIDPDQEELAEQTGNIQLYISDFWNRPTGKPAEFTYAPSGRASCGICQKRISKGKLKIVKPEFIEIPNGRTVPGNTSFHIDCIMENEHGEEVLHEAVTRLSIDIINENKEDLEKLRENLPEIKAKELLSRLL